MIENSLFVTIGLLPAPGGKRPGLRAGLEEFQGGMFFCDAGCIMPQGNLCEAQTYAHVHTFTHIHTLKTYDKELHSFTQKHP